MEKKITFEDGSFINFSMNGEKLQIIIQAKNLGKDFKITSASVCLNEKEADELAFWLHEATLGHKEQF